MKLAYIATDKSCLKTFGALKSNYSVVDYYVANEELPLADLEIEKLPIVTETVTIPSDKTLLTQKHKQVLKRLKAKHLDLLNQIYSAKVGLETVSEGTTHAEFTQKKISDISFIKFNKEINKYTIETSQQEIIEYDYLLIENNQNIMNAILDKQQNLFHLFTEQSRSLLTLVYEIDSNHQHKQTSQNFIYIENSLIKSIEDNWYVFRLSENQLSVSLYIPLEMQNSQEYIEFLSLRISDMIGQNFVAYKVKNYLKSYGHPVDGFFSYKAKLRNAKHGALVPVFTFWSHDKMNSYLAGVLKNKPISKNNMIDKNI